MRSANNGHAQPCPHLHTMPLLRYWLGPLLLCVRYPSAALLLLHVMWYITSRLLQMLMLFVGGGTFWWMLRSYQLQKEQELLDHAVLKFKFYRKYHRRSSSTSRRDGESIQQLRGRERLSVVAHLRSSWHLPSELCDAITALVELIVQNYVDGWFQAVSPDQDFSTDVKLLLADLLGALASRVLEIESSQALTIFAKSLELLRLHLGWFREVYAQLADEYPDIFEGDENDVNLLKRQMYVAAFVRKSSFVHPGCVNLEVIPSESTLGQGCSDKKSGDDAADAYLRHVATQLLTYLKPQLGQEQDTNVFVSMAVNLLREVAVFKILKPLSEYSQPRYANEIVVSCLREVVDEKVAMMSRSPGIVSLGNGVGKVPTMTLNKLRSTSSSLYKASRRSGEHAEAAFQAVVEAVASAASSAAAGAAEMVFEGDDWTDLGSNPFAFGSAVFGASSSGGIGDRKAVPSRYGLDDRLSVTKTAKMMNPRGLIPGGLLSHKMVVSENSRIGAHMDDLMMNAKSNIGSSLNSSIGKVKKRFRTLGNHPMDSLSTPPLSAGAGTAARMIRKPGQLLQKAWKRSESTSSMRSSSFDGDALTPTGQTRVRSRTRTLGLLNPLESPICNDEEMAATQMSSRSTCMVAVRGRVVTCLEKAVADYTKMHDECSETRSSVHSHELYDLLSAMENVLMLGFRGHDSDDEGDDKQPSTPPLSPIVRRCSSVASTNDGATSSRRDSVDTDRCYYSDEEQHDDQYYWEFLARDRPGAGMLNAHWRSVVSDCEACIPSESFISTRGVQWLLAAITKGSLGTLCAELHAHSEVTELFYEDFALLLDSSLTDSMLHTLHQLDRLDVSLDVYAFRSSQSDVDQELGVSPSHQWQSGDETSSCAPVCVLERVWETERYVPINGWVKVTDKRRQELPSSEWVWEHDWRLDNSGSGLGEVPDSKATASTWQYARTFEDDFHDTEMELDCVRRRRWVRQRRQHPADIPPSSLQVFPKTIGLSSPLASFAVSNGVDKAKKKEQRCNASNREHKKNGGVKSVMESRLKSFGRVMADTSTRHATLGMTDLDDLQRASTKTLAFMKARASIPSLRRGISSMSMKSPTSDTQSLRAKHSIDENLAVLCDEDRNDGETFCSRCLTALPCCESSECTCESCHERVCASCLAFHAFMVYPPPLETSKKARVCGICYGRLVSKYKLRLEAHVGKYLTEESEPETRGGSGLSTFSSFADEDAGNGISYRSGSSIGYGGTSEDTCSSSGTGQASCLLSPSVGQDGQNFEITVQVNGNSAYAWHVVRTFHDFEVLEKQLVEKLEKQEKKYGMGCRAYHLNGVDYTEMSCIKPSLKTAVVTALTYKKQLYIVEHFLQQLLACDTLCQSSVLQQFLLLPVAFTMSRATGNPSLSVQETDTSKRVSILADGNRTSLSAASSTGDSVIDNTAGRRGEVDSAEGMANGAGKWQKERWVAADGNSKETKMRVLQKIEVSLFAVLGEVFEFDGIGVVRRQIFSVTRSFIKAFLGASHFRMLERQLLSFTDPTKLSGWITDLRLYIFPGPGSADIVPCPAPDMQVLRKECLEAILASFPSKVLSLFGDTACENASLKLHEFLQHEVFVKNLLFSITDELLLHLFPYSTTFKGMDTPNEIPAAPMPAGSSAAEVATTISREAVAASIIDGTVS